MKKMIICSILAALISNVLICSETTFFDNLSGSSDQRMYIQSIVYHQKQDALMKKKAAILSSYVSNGDMFRCSDDKEVSIRNWIERTSIFIMLR